VIIVNELDIHLMEMLKDKLLTDKYLHKFCNFIEGSNWIQDYDFWLLGSFPKVLDRTLPAVRDMDIAVVSKDGYHNKNEISNMLSKCILHMGQGLDIYYRPNLNNDLKEKGMDTIMTSNQFWGDIEKWPTKQNYQSWRVKNYRPLELWYSNDDKLEVRYVLFPLEKHIERVIDGHVYAKPILLNNYIKKE